MIPRTGNRKKRSFTLVEVLVATSVLALGATLLYGAFFISLDSFRYYSDYLTVSSWLDEQIWQAQDSLRRNGTAQLLPVDEKIVKTIPQLNQHLSDRLIEESTAEKLYEAELTVSWQEGRKKIKILRNAYATYQAE